MAGLEVPGRPPPGFPGLETREDHPRHLRVPGKVIGHLDGILVVLAQPQRQGFKARISWKAFLRGDGRPDVAQRTARARRI